MQRPDAERPRTRLWAQVTRSARGVTEVVKQATKLDEHGQYWTNRRHIVMLSRPGRNMSDDMCLLVREKALSRAKTWLAQMSRRTIALLTRAEGR